MFIFIFILLFSTSVVCAAPNVTGVTGTFAHGQSVTLSGSDFGTKATAGPLVWDDFESGVSGNVIAGNAPVVENMVGSWVWDDLYSDTERARYGNEQNRVNSLLNSKHHFVSDSYNVSLEVYYPLTGGEDDVYFTYYMKYDKTSVNWSRNFKPWIVYGSAGDGYHPAAYDGWGNPAVSDESLRSEVQDVGATDASLYSEPYVNHIEGEWIRLELYLKQSSSGSFDGVWQLWVHRPSADGITLQQVDLTYRTRSSSDYWQQWNFGTYHDNNPTSAVGDVFIDDFYFDNTRARVEIGDASTWAACTHREIQLPTSWSPSSVTITANRGTFSDGSTVYLYVVDPNGDVNTSGYAMTVGGSTTATTPKAPTNLQVN